MTHFYLYGTESCHLCEQAETLIAPLLVTGNTVEVVDISESDVLMNRYGVRIPVLQRMDSGEELDWPFDEAVLGGFLDSP